MCYNVENQLKNEVRVMSETLKIVSFNLRCSYEGDGVNSFIHRAGSILDKINSEQPDIICAQEAVPSHVKFLRKNLTDYITIYNGRNADFGGEGLGLLIKKSRINLIGLDFFWLSETPYVPASRFAEQSGCPRICQVAMLQIDGTDKIFYVYNNHLDHKSDSARILGIRQVLERVKADNERMPFPLFILGDFNATPDSETIQYCYNYKPVELVDHTTHIPTTFHRHGTLDYDEKIDYIFTDKATAPKVKSVEAWDDVLNGIYLSDHYPVSMTVELD
ncbi:MAG: endonuclease/exonuclease/phosphatase family protein [Clostridia bacterium]|nr:endonuclease/exonuclease/phosphatase family protein [Clostridia bacterium]